MKVLVIGSGGREHALCWKIAQSPRLSKLWCAPGNPGIAQVAECVPLSIKAPFTDILTFCSENAVDLVIPGPETPLVDGLADALHVCNIACCGPSLVAAQLEGSKAFMKELCVAAGIPTAKAKTFTDYESALAHGRTQPYPLVIKADGLAAGKGVLIVETEEAAKDALTVLMLEARFGNAGKTVIIEEFLEGQELSFFALSDGRNVIPFGDAQDYKRAYSGNQGPNTGGMGSISPSPLFDTDDLTIRIMDQIIVPTLDAMTALDAPFVGILFAGIMLTKDGPKLLEYNVRFGDPETQSLVLRMDFDLLEWLDKAARRALDGLVTLNHHYATSVVIAAPGYPQEPHSREPIRLGSVPDGAVIFHAGTKLADGQLVAAGGRVLTISASGDSREAATKTAYEAVKAVDWDDGWYRQDIGS